jgi:hypothetical protein
VVALVLGLALVVLATLVMGGRLMRAGRARAAPLMVSTREARSESDASVSVNVGFIASYREAARA